MTSAVNKAKSIAPIMDLFSWILLWVSPVLGMIITYHLTDLFIPSSHFPISEWAIMLLPIGYFAWLLVFLSLSASEMMLIGLYFKKPTRFTPTGTYNTLLQQFTLRYIYKRMLFLRNVPLFDFLAMVPRPLKFLRILAMRAYSNKVHIGEMAEVVVWPQDPDLTFIGDFVTIGYETTIVAHGGVRDKGKMVFASAPIEIGNQVTIGGSCRINMGVIIGKGSIVEVGSNVLPYTRIPPGEVWGGNPAVFRRKVLDNNQNNEQTLPASSNDTDIEDVKSLIANVLKVPASSISNQAVSKDFKNWDSLATMAICAALYDKYTIQIPPDNLTSLTSVQGVLQATKEFNNETGSIEDTFTLPTDPGLFPLHDFKKVTSALIELNRNITEEPSRTLFIASSFTINSIASSTVTWCKGIGIPYSVEICEYNQIEQELLLPNSNFSKNANGVNLILIRIEDLMADGSNGLARADSILSAIKTYSNASKPHLLVSNLPTIVSSFFLGNYEEANKLQDYWIKSLSKIPSVQVFDFNSTISMLGSLRCRDSESEVISRAPYSREAYQLLGISVARHLSKLHRPAKKVVALDCDNTLWGGVVGEDGLDGIALGDDFPGRSYKLFQQQLLKLKEKGILLVIVSKNEKADVWEVMDKHPDMLIKKHDLSGYRINWQSKSSNIKSLARELNLGEDSFVFFDDSQAECFEVNTNAPSVSVVPLTMKPMYFCDVLSKLWFFDVTAVTEEDKLRAGFLAQNQEREALKNSSSDLSEYLNSLGLKVSMRIASEQDLPRVAQLTNKTNQFNLSLRRRTLSEIQNLSNEYFVLAAEVIDIFGNYGLVGVCIVKHDASSDTLCLDTFLMSCRTLGREVEFSFITAVRELSEKLQCKGVKAEFIQGPRNQQVKEFLIKSGFEIQNEGEEIYYAENSKLIPLPQHIEWSFKLE